MSGQAQEADWEQTEFAQAKSIVLNQLAASAKSRAQLEQKLNQKGFSQALIADLLDRCEARGLVNDQEFAQLYLASRARSRKLANAAISRELREKGLAADIIERVLTERGPEQEQADAAELVRKKIPAGADLRDFEERQKITRRLLAMLGRKGYSSSLARAVVQQHIEAQLDQA